MQHFVSQGRLCHGVRLLLSRSMDRGQRRSSGCLAQQTHTALVSPEGESCCAGAGEENHGRPPQALHIDRRSVVARTVLQAPLCTHGIGFCLRELSDNDTQCTSYAMSVVEWAPGLSVSTLPVIAEALDACHKVSALDSAIITRVLPRYLVC